MTLAERARVAELPADTLLTPEETAAWLGLDTVRHLTRLGVPSLRLGHRTTRYRKGTVAAWLDTKAEARKECVA
jgi:hypothetical protein